MSRLHVDSINKSYGQRLLLSDVFLSCNQGEVVGLLGRNGSGKSTLLKIIFGTETAHHKFIKADGVIVKNVNHSRNLINYLPQDHFLPNQIQIKKLLSLFLEKKEREILMENHLIQPLLGKKNEELSGGEKRVLEIMMIIHSKAKFILLDEPFNGVSPLIREQIFNDVLKSKTKKGFIITDHNYKNVIDMADRLLLLKDGAIKEIKHNHDLVEHGYLTENSYDQQFGS